VNVSQPDVSDVGDVVALMTLLVRAGSATGGVTLATLVTDIGKTLVHPAATRIMARADIVARIFICFTECCFVVVMLCTLMKFTTHNGLPLAEGRS
jgi:hypothetical protein